MTATLQGWPSADAQEELCKRGCSPGSPGLPFFVISRVPHPGAPGPTLSVLLSWEASRPSVQQSWGLSISGSPGKGAAGV